MPPKRFVGLSKQQPVPRLLSVIGKAPVTDKMKDVAEDAPPLSSSDPSDNEGLSRRGHIEPSRFLDPRRQRRSSTREAKNDETAQNSSASGTRFKRPRGSARLPNGTGPGSSPRETKGRPPDAIDIDNGMSSPASKKPKRSSPGQEEQRNPFDGEIFPAPKPKPAVVRKYGGKPNVFMNKSKSRREASSAKTSKPPPKEEASSDIDEDAGRFKLKMPDYPSTPVKDPDSSPARKLHTLPDIDLNSPTEPSPMRKKRLKMPADDDSLERETPEESQRLVFRVPDALPDSFIADDDDGKQDFTTSPTADPSNTPNLLRDSSSPLTDLDSLEPDPDPICPLCGKEVDRSHLDEYKKTNPRGRVANMRRFCEAHRRRSAREAWVQRGYPDIDWQRFDERIARHYPFVRRLLEEKEKEEEDDDGNSSHYRKLFSEMVRAGRNKSLLTSDANLTPGYYGFRGLRAMTEGVVTEFGPLLLKRSREDRLVSARGTTMYVQAVVVPELAVRLIMEDMSVGEEEARRILAESTEVGELLNDEIPDVVVSSDDESDDGAYRNG